VERLHYAGSGTPASPFARSKQQYPNFLLEKLKTLARRLLHCDGSPGEGSALMTQSSISKNTNSILADERFAIDSFDWLDPFDPHSLWPGGWMQTLSIKAMSPELRPDNYSGVVPFDVEGDQTPPDVLSGYYFPPPKDCKKPTVIVFHGMGGHALSGYMRSMAESLLDANYPVILWNNRGAGDSAAQCTRMHHPGYTDDVCLLMDHLQDQRPEWCGNGLAAIALSLGANLLLKYLAEQGNDSPLDAATCVSAPLDMQMTSQNLRRGANRVFDRYLLWRQRKELLRDKAELTEDERQAIESAGSVWELDDRFTAPHLDYAGAEDFYRDNSAIHVLGKITTPTLLLHALDDPVVDADVFTAFDWQPSGPLYPALADSGGHTGFLGSDSRRWNERASIRFLDTMT